MSLCIVMITLPYTKILLVLGPARVINLSHINSSSLSCFRAWKRKLFFPALFRSMRDFPNKCLNLFSLCQWCLHIQAAIDFMLWHSLLRLQLTPVLIQWIWAGFSLQSRKLPSFISFLRLCPCCSGWIPNIAELYLLLLADIFHFLAAENLFTIF